MIFLSCFFFFFRNCVWTKVNHVSCPKLHTQK